MKEAAWLIRDGVLLSSSIDDFLDIHHQNERVVHIGKAAIVKSILEAERASKLYYDRSNIYNKMNLSMAEGTWLIKFVRMLGRGIPVDTVETLFDNVAFIVFNYDRCIEHFLFIALKQLFNLDDRRASNIMTRLTIVHPYGMVAPAEYLDYDGIPFGGPLHGEPQYVNLGQRIKTYTEQREGGEEMEAIRNEVQRADKIVFLGFAFHDQNIQLLKPNEGIGHKEIIGSAFGMSDSDINIVRAHLITFFQNNLRIPGMVIRRSRRS
jgi:hypothetical protein